MPPRGALPIGRSIVRGAPAPEQVVVGIDPAVAQEGPVATHVLDPSRIAFHDQVLLAFMTAALQDDAEWVADERGPPEVEARLGRALVSHAVDGADVEAVG